MGANLSPEAVLIIVLLSFAVWAGQGIARGAKKVGHEVKCGAIKLFTAHECKNPLPKDPAPVTVSDEEAK